LKERKKHASHASKKLEETMEIFSLGFWDFGIGKK
jgi:hypothetical protein